MFAFLYMRRSLFSWSKCSPFMVEAFTYHGRSVDHRRSKCSPITVEVFTYHGRSVHLSWSKCSPFMVEVFTFHGRSVDHRRSKRSPLGSKWPVFKPFFGPRYQGFIKYFIKYFISLSIKGVSPLRGGQTDGCIHHKKFSLWGTGQTLLRFMPFYVRAVIRWHPVFSLVENGEFVVH